MKTTTTYRQKDNGWQIIVSYKDGNRWKQKSRQGFPTKREAKEHEEELIRAIKKPRPVTKDMAGITLSDFCEVYLKAQKHIYTTEQIYRRAVKSLCDVAKKPVHMITYLDLQNAVNGWNTKPGTQKQYKKKLASLFKSAIKPYGIISSNPMTDITIAKARRTERIVITEEEFKQLLSAAKHPQARLCIAICYYTGLRKAELLGLTWNDIDWKHSEIIVNKQLNTTHTGKMEIVPLKTDNGYRRIPVPAVLLKILKEYKYTTPLRIDGYIIYRPTGTYHALRRALKSISPDFTLHCLRHTYATNLLAKGMDIRTVAALLGDHVNTVLNTYVHYSDEMREAAAKDIEKIFATNF